MKKVNDYELYELFEKALTVSDQRKKNTALEQVALLVKEDNSPQLAERIYYQLYNSSNTSAEDFRGATLGVALLRQLYDRHPGAIDGTKILNCYIGMFAYFSGYLILTRTQIKGLLAESEQLVLKLGMSKKINLFLRAIAALALAEIEDAKWFINEWDKIAFVERDFPCSACMMSHLLPLQMYYETNDMTKLMRDAEKLNRFNDKCKDNNQNTALTFELLFPLAKVSRAKEGEVIYQQVKNTVFSSRDEISMAAACIRFLALTEYGEKLEDEALRMIDNYVKPAIATQNFLRAFSFYQAAWLYFRNWQNNRELHLHLPVECSIKNQTGLYASAVLETWFRKQALILAEKIDRRNESDYFTRIMINKGVK